MSLTTRFLAAGALVAALAVVAPAPQAADEVELLPNRSFEGTLRGWRAWNARLSLVRPGRFGRHAARVTATTSSSFSVYPHPVPVGSTVRGGRVTGRAYVRSASPRRICLRIREWAGADVAGSAQRCTVAGGRWRFLGGVDYVAREDRNRLDAYLYAPAAERGAHFDVDAVSLAGTLPAPPADSPATLLAAGDVASCASEGDEATAALLDRLPGTIAVLGDAVYENGTPREFAECFAPSWGRHRQRMRPAIGNHEYGSRGGAPYWDYFGDAAGPRGKGWYSYDLGAWHVVVLNSNCSRVGCADGGEQHDWLERDLAAHPARCTIAYMHHPRFSSGLHGPDVTVQPLWEALYAAGADVVLAGHDHDYERFAPQTPAGALDRARGIRQFVAGTGGRGTYFFREIQPNTEARNSKTFGLLELKLGRDRYEWRFVPVAGASFTDAGSDTCH